MSEKRDLTPLLEPIKIGSTTLKNRIVFPAMCTNYSDDHGSLTPQLLAFIEARAAGGVGMCILPGTVYGSPGRERQAITDDSCIQGWRNLKTRLSHYNVKLICQLHPDPRLLKKPEDYTLEQIHSLIRDYTTAARRAREAGLDGVEVSGRAQEIALFLSHHYNRRQDTYGGDLEGRSRLALEILRAVKENCGPDLPIIFRLSLEERIAGGRDIAESLRLVRLLENAGADAIHASIGCPDSLPWEQGPPEVPPGNVLPLAAEVKKTVSIPVITVGRINDLSLAASAITAGWTDMVALGRALLADPELPVKSLENRQAEIRRCIACNQGCSNKSDQVSCLQNPGTGREYLPLERKVGPEAVKRVLIAGAGPAGLEAAYILAEKGHDVQIYEQQSEAGGTFRLACRPPFKEGFFEVIRYRLSRLSRLGVEIHYRQKVDLALIKKIVPQVLIIATGSLPEKSAFPIEGREVYTADQVLSGQLPQGHRILLVGGGKIAFEVADFISSQNYKVDIAGRGKSMTEVLNDKQQRFLINRLLDKEVRFIQEADVLGVNLPQARLVVNQREEIRGEYDAVVLATGRQPNRELSTAVQNYSPDLEIFTIGDAHLPRTALKAIHEAALLSAGI
jgi:2,4-dienoyl-CoA reductase-like NADH-dependent reductase (Old Yellow Enzyme family)/thioredoxin reductase